MTWSFEAGHRPQVGPAFTHVSACLFAESPRAIRYIKGFNGFVTSSVASIASGWSDPSPGGNLTHWESPNCMAHSILTPRGHGNADCGYSDFEVLSNSTVIATTYLKQAEEPGKHSVMTTRFTFEEAHELTRETVPDQ